MKPSCYTCQKYCDCEQPPIISAACNRTIESGIYFVLDSDELFSSDGTLFESFDALELAWYEQFASQYDCYKEKEKELKK